MHAHLKETPPESAVRKMPIVPLVQPKLTSEVPVKIKE